MRPNVDLHKQAKHEHRCIQFVFATTAFVVAVAYIATTSICRLLNSQTSKLGSAIGHCVVDMTCNWLCRSWLGNNRQVSQAAQGDQLASLGESRKRKKPRRACCSGQALAWKELKGASSKTTSSIESR